MSRSASGPTRWSSLRLRPNTIAKMATGVADNLLLTTYLSARCPVFVAPAMDLDMYAHPTTRYNLDSLKSYGCRIIERLRENCQRPFGQRTDGGTPPRSRVRCRTILPARRSLQGRTLLVTAGPTDRADRPRSLHIEPFVWQDGLCLGRGTARPGSRRDSGDRPHGIADSRRDAGAGGYDGRRDVRGPPCMLSSVATEP